MSEIENGDFEDVSCDPHQNQPTQDTLACDSLVRKTVAKTYTDSIWGRGRRERRDISEEDVTALSQDRNAIYLLSPTIVHTGKCLKA